MNVQLQKQGTVEPALTPPSPQQQPLYNGNGH